MANAGELKVKVSADIKPYETALKRAEGIAAAAGAKIKGAFSAVGTGAEFAAIGGGIAAAFAGTKLAQGVSNIFELGSGLNALSATSGVSVKNLVLLQDKFASVGLDAEDASKAVNKLQIFLSEAGKDEEKRGLLGALNLNLQTLLRLRPEEQLARVGDAINRIGDEGRSTAAVVKVFGEEGAKLKAVFGAGPLFQASEATRAQAELLDKNSKTFAEIYQRLNGPNGVMRGLYIGVGSSVAPALLAAVKQFQQLDLTAVGKSFANSLIGAATTTTKVVTALASVAGTVGRITASAPTVTGKTGNLAKGLAGVGLQTAEAVTGVAEYVASGRFKLADLSPERWAPGLTKDVKGIGKRVSAMLGGGEDLLPGLTVEDTPIYDYVSGRRPDWNTFYKTKPNTMQIGRRGTALLGNDAPDGGPSARIRAAFGWAPDDGKSSLGDTLRASFGWDSSKSEGIRSRWGWEPGDEAEQMRRRGAMGRNRRDEAGMSGKSANGDPATDSSVQELLNAVQGLTETIKGLVAQ